MEKEMGLSFLHLLPAGCPSCLWCQLLERKWEINVSEHTHLFKRETLKQDVHSVVNTKTGFLALPFQPRLTCIYIWAASLECLTPLTRQAEVMDKDKWGTSVCFYYDRSFRWYWSVGHPHLGGASQRKPTLEEKRKRSNKTKKLW